MSFLWPELLWSLLALPLLVLLYWLALRLWWHSTPSSRRSLPDAPMLPTSKSSTALPPQLLRRSVWLPGQRIWGNSPFPATIPTAS